MSKELEALNYLVNLAVVGNKEKHRGKIFDSEEIIIKLIKRDTPMKPLIDKLDLWDEYKCPVCESTVWEVHVHKDENFCNNCGQRLDWSE